MLQATYTTHFEKDVKLAKKQNKNMSILKIIIEKILNNEIIPIKYHDHWLTGNYVNRRECHLEPDWLLIYQPRKKNNEIIFERLGSHFFYLNSLLFNKIQRNICQ